MSSTILTALGALLVILLAGAAVFVIGMRMRSRLVLLPIFWFQRTVVNPRQMRTAGTPGAYASIIRHRGRVTGRDLQTPVGVIPADGAFYITLPYGPDTDWARNVLASGSATIVHAGEAHDVARPEIVPMRAVSSVFSAVDLRLGRVLGMDECLRLWPVSRGPGPA